MDGKLMHERAHNENLTELRGETLITRGMSVFSRRLGLSGKCDVLEFRMDKTGVPISGRDGLWRPFPVEYKRGMPNERSGDTVQLCAQAMCLEEMLCCDIPVGALFYGENKRRTQVEFTAELRAEVEKYVLEMHDMYARGYTPRVKPSKSCNACSLKDICLPRLMSARSVAEYMREAE